MWKFRNVAIAMCACAGVASSVLGQCPGAPVVEADLGTLTPGTPISTTASMNGAVAKWFKFTTTSAVDMSALTFVDITTSTTVGLDTELGLYDCAGNLVATDDDDAEGLISALSFGSGSALQIGAGGVWSNGRDGRLPAGEYYLAVCLFNTTFNLSGFSVTPAGTAVGTANLSLTMGSATALADPVGTVDLGTMSATDTRNRVGDALAASQVLWYKVTVPASGLAANRFFDIDTEGSVLSATNATRLAVYNITGVITGTLAPATRLSNTTGLTDATDGTNSLSQISLGVGTRPAPGNGVAYNGRDGDLQAGTYFIGVAGPGTAPSGTTAAGANFAFASTSTNTGTINLNLATGNGVIPLAVTGNAVTAPEVSSVLLRATVTPGNPPPSSGTTVTVDLSSIGGSSTQAFFDNGTNGDVAAGDNIFSYSYPLPINVLTGSYPLPVSAADAQSRTATGTLTLTVSNGPGGACCNGATCSVTRQTLCVAGDGSWQGSGTSCGGPSYTFSTSNSPFIDISATGTLLATISNADDSTQNVALPFTFSHLGNAYTSVNVSSNGNLQFGASNSTAYANVTIPNTAVPNDMLAPLWDDYDMTDTRNGPGLGGCYYLDDSANGRVIFSWQGVGQYNTANPVVDANDFQAILYSNGNVEFRYGNVPTILSPQIAGDTVTIGFESSDGTFGGEYPGASVGAGNTTVVLVASVIPGPCGPTCDTIDFNHDDLFPDTLDIDDFLSVFSGGSCSNDPNCGDIDFNNDGLFPDTLDIDALISVFSGGPCLI